MEENDKIFKIYACGYSTLICTDTNKRFWNKRGFKFEYNYMTRGI